ncbi:MAG: hypothetical protein U5O39_19925 [Gammaproteobacteria bacterium]|nr:hypothetical protein [Gammaproteobacteria bacterium]
MAEHDLELEGSTLRQRRNLILVTTSLVFVHVAGVEFGSEFRFLGSVVQVGNPGAIPLFLVLFQGYFLWRFYQYFHTDHAYNALKQQLRRDIGTAQDKVFLRLLMAQIPERSIHGGADSLRGATLNDSGKYVAKVKVPINETSQTETRKLEVPSFPIKMQAVYVSLLYLFRGKILSDFYLPYLWVVFSIWVAV